MIAGITDRLRNIVQSTAGEVLWYEGKPAATYYHANCGGTTEDGRFILGNDEAPAPYLVQHSDTYCIRNGGTQWHSEVTKRELQRALGRRRHHCSRYAAFGFDRAAHSQRPRRVVARCREQVPITVPGVAFRSAVGRHIGWDRLKSNWYEVSVTGDRVSFTGRGSGHGVGLCQIGAEVMGEEGKSYREILAYYYPGTKLGTAAAGNHVAEVDRRKRRSYSPRARHRIRRLLPWRCTSGARGRDEHRTDIPLRTAVEGVSHSCNVS